MHDQQWFLSQVGRFESHCRKHIFEPAKVLACDFQANTPPLNDSGFFILCGVVPYFEGLGQHLLGGDKDKAFAKGFADVYEYQLGSGVGAVADQVKELVRHGLFHDAAVRAGAWVSREFPVSVRLEGNQLQVNPARLVDDLLSHLAGYVARLRDFDPNHDRIREQFVKRRRKFEEDFKGPLPPGMSITTPSPNDPRFLYGAYRPDGTLPLAPGTE